MILKRKIQKKKEIYKVLMENENHKKFIECIELLEEKKGALSSERFIPNIFYSAYIKSYLYQFIYFLHYKFKKENDKVIKKKKVEPLIEKLGNSENISIEEEEIEDYEWISFKKFIQEEYDNDEISQIELENDDNHIINEYEIGEYILPIIKSIRGEKEADINSRTRKVLEIYTFRLIYNFLNKDYNNFKKYDFDSKFLNYRSIFIGKEAIEEENPKFIDFCGKTIEDFINIPDETPKEAIDEQNFYTHSLLSIRLVGRAALKNGMISQKDYKDIWNYFIEKLKKKKFNIDLKIEDIFLSFDIIDDLSYNLTNLLTQEKNFFKINNSNEYNNKYIGIIIYTMRICFHSFTIDNGFEKYFYSKLLNPNANLIGLINNNYVPGFNRGKKGIEKIKLQDLINNNNYKIKINKNENEIQINPLTILILRFLFYSHLLFATLLQKVDIKNIINCFSTSENYSLLKIIIELWEKINELIPGKENNKIEILLNRINKDIVKIYNQCQNLEEENDRNIFENNFNNYMNECFEDYEYFKLIYFDNTMKAIIQEDNYPLSYNKIEYPYIKYFVVSHYPKMDDLQIKRDEYITKNEWDLCMIDSIF